jgi:hypothetical protein
VLRNALLEVRPRSSNNNNNNNNNDNNNNNNDWPTKKLFLHELMLNKELETIEHVSWKTPRAEYDLEFQQPNVLNTINLNPIRSASLQLQLQLQLERQQLQSSSSSTDFNQSARNFIFEMICLYSSSKN